MSIPLRWLLCRVRTEQMGQLEVNPIRLNSEALICVKIPGTSKLPRSDANNERRLCKRLLFFDLIDESRVFQS